MGEKVAGSAARAQPSATLAGGRTGVLSDLCHLDLRDDKIGSYNISSFSIHGGRPIDLRILNLPEKYIVYLSNHSFS